jgi:hypothetical protein
MKGNISWRRYLAVGILSLLKAAVVRGNRRRLTTELTDAGLFLGLAVLLRWAEGDGDDQDRRPPWADAIRRFQATDGEDSKARVKQLVEQGDVQQMLREEVPRRIRQRSEEGDERKLGDRIRSR